MRKTLVALVLAAAVAALAANASRAFSGNQCTIVTGKQLATFGIAAKCQPKTIHGPGFTLSNAIWNLSSTPHLAVGVYTYASASGPAWDVAMKTLKVLPGGQGRKVSGIGSIAYETGGAGSTVAAINFVEGKTIVNINLGTKAPPSLSAFNALAKSVAAKVR